MSGCGGGIASLEDSSPLIEDCLLLENNAFGDTFGWGGGLVIREASATLVNCVIAGNYAVSGGGILVYHGQGTFIGCTISGNHSDCGGGVDLTHGSSETTFRECTIAGNQAWNQGGGITGESMRLEQTIVWGNCCHCTNPEMDQIRASGDLEFVCCALDSAGIFTTGEITYSNCAFSDPLFCAPISCEEAPTAEGDYRLDATSPCVPSNSPCGEWIGALHVGCPLSDVIGDLRVQNRPTMEILPNPATGVCRIRFRLPTATMVDIDLLDAEGRMVRNLWEGMVEGEHQVTWDGRAADGRALPAGIYWSRLRSGEEHCHRSILIVR